MHQNHQLNHWNQKDVLDRIKTNWRNGEANREKRGDQQHNLIKLVFTQDRPCFLKIVNSNNISETQDQIDDVNQMEPIPRFDWNNEQNDLNDAQKHVQNAHLIFFCTLQRVYHRSDWIKDILNLNQKLYISPYVFNAIFVFIHRVFIFNRNIFLDEYFILNLWLLKLFPFIFAYFWLQLQNRLDLKQFDERVDIFVCIVFIHFDFQISFMYVL